MNPQVKQLILFVREMHLFEEIYGTDDSANLEGRSREQIYCDQVDACNALDPLEEVKPTLKEVCGCGEPLILPNERMYFQCIDCMEEDHEHNKIEEVAV